jgi:dTDP-4-dehydrorhamnose reductase
VLVAEDAFVSPTYVPDLVHASLDLLIDGEAGRWHLASRGAVSWAELARQAAQLAGMDSSGITACRMRCMGLTARRPSYSVLGSERAAIMPALDEALPRYFRDCRAAVPG